MNINISRDTNICTAMIYKTSASREKEKKNGQEASFTVSLTFFFF